jgi:ABC-type transport system involved in cytochrome c biogenesis permease subunit
MTEASTGTGSPSRTALASGPVWRAGLLATLAATAVNVVAWLVLQQLLDADLQIPVQPGEPELQSLPVAPVILITLVSGLLGTVALWLLTRRGPSGVRLWTVLAAVFGVVSGFGALSLDVSLGRQLGLFLFHLLAAATMITVVRRQLGSRAQ